MKKITLLNFQNNENGSEMRFDQHNYDNTLSVKCIFDLCDKMKNFCATLFYTPWQCIIKQQYFRDPPADCLVFRKLLSALINQDKEQGITYSRKGLVEKKCPSYIWTKNNGVTGV